MSTTEREKIIQRIKKLKEHAINGRTVEEAESFTLKIQELMLEYNISMMEVDNASDQTQTADFKNWIYTEKISYRDTVAGSAWLHNLIKILTRLNFCDCVFTPEERAVRIWGHAENIDTIVYLFNHIGIVFFKIATEHYKQHNPEGLGKRAYLREFLMGAVQGLGDKLYQQRNAQQQANNKVTALVKVNRDALQRYCAARVPNGAHFTTGSSGLHGVRGTAAYSKGVQVGKAYTPGGKLNGKNNNKFLG